MSKETSQLNLAVLQLLSSGSEEKSFEIINIMLNLMSKDLDLSGISKDVIKLLALPFRPLKKVVCAYLIRYSSIISDINTLATNSLLLDFQDPNPYIRKLVVKTCCSVPSLHELAGEILPKALQDPSAYVRFSAASSSPSFINESNLDSSQDIIDLLYENIKDNDSSVVVSSLSALDEILKAEGGIVINSKIAQYLMSRFSQFSEWDFPVICGILKKYIPVNSSEVSTYLQTLDSSLSHSNPAVFIPVTELALHFTSKHQKCLKEAIIQKFLNQVKLLLSVSNSENLLFLLEIVEKHLEEHEEILFPHYKLFLCRFCDSALVKVKKISILSNLINKNNDKEIIDEILSHCSINTPEVSKHAVRIFVTVLQSHDLPNIHMKTFLYLLNIQHNNLYLEIIIALSFLDLNLVLNEKQNILNSVFQHFHKVTSIEGKKALLRIISNYASEIEASAYIVHELAAESDILKNEALLTQLLHTSLKLFLIRPAEMQLFLGQLLKSMKSSDSIFVRKQASIYFHLLNDLKMAKNVANLDEPILLM